ncbi:MAG TPA: SRPBCC family protein [Egibacteraceae bacterium]|nr:SRPBCC family protein [Egibacteraceae bacterium]
MIDVTASITIDRPVDEVFAYVNEPANEPHWHTDVLEATRASEGAIGIGTTYDLKIKPFMGISEGTTQVVEFEPDRRAVWRGEMGSMRPTLTYQFEPAAGGTRFTRRVQFELPGMMRLMEPLARASGRKRNAGFLSNLKRVLEQESASRSS